jgi:hypothetical protein
VTSRRLVVSGAISATSCRLARDAGLGQGQHDPLRVHQTAQAVEVLLHVLGIDVQPLDHAGQALQGEVKMDGGVGTDAAFDRGMADVPLVPQGDVFHRRGHG